MAGARFNFNAAVVPSVLAVDSKSRVNFNQIAKAHSGNGASKNCRRRSDLDRSRAKEDV